MHMSHACLNGTLWTSGRHELKPEVRRHGTGTEHLSADHRGALGPPLGRQQGGGENSCHDHTARAAARDEGFHKGQVHVSVVNLLSTQRMVWRKNDDQSMDYMLISAYLLSNLYPFCSLYVVRLTTMLVLSMTSS